MISNFFLSDVYLLICNKKLPIKFIIVEKQISVSFCLSV